jgi:hypothetical protein
VTDFADRLLLGGAQSKFHLEFPPVWAIDVLKSGSSMSEVEGDSENITDAIKQENATSINKIRSLFVDPGFPAAQFGDAESAASSEKSNDSEV